MFPLRNSRSLIVVLACAVLWTSGLSADESGRGIWNIDLENDMWGNGDDGHYTHGTEISRRAANPPDWLKKFAGRLPCGPCRNPSAVGYEFGQSIYTPNDTSRSSLIAADRPYAGWLYLGARLLKETQTPNGARTDTIGLQLGMIGPAAFADRTQVRIHEHRKLSMPRGWQHQLRNEAGFVLHYRRSWDEAPQQGFGFGATPYVMGTLGNVQTHLAGGVTFRAGFNLGKGETSRRRSTPSWHVFLGMEGRGVARNILLDGNTWTESHRVEKRPVVGELQAGVSFTGAGLEIKITQTIRSREFYGQLEPDRYGSVSFTYRP